MAMSIEARVPLLDHHIVEFALNLPAHMKLRGGRTKSILRQAVKSMLPRLVLEKSKEGFSVPMKHWLCTSLKPMMFELLSKDALQKHGYFDHQVVAQWVQEHVDGRANHSHRLWPLMVFEMWHHNQRVAA
jgi:asparagine synthase (glutamine-hydrolysing)